MNYVICLVISLLPKKGCFIGNCICLSIYCWKFSLLDIEGKSEFMSSKRWNRERNLRNWILVQCLSINLKFKRKLLVAKLGNNLNGCFDERFFATKISVHLLLRCTNWRFSVVSLSLILKVLNFPLNLSQFYLGKRKSWKWKKFIMSKSQHKRGKLLPKNENFQDFHERSNRS